MNYFVCPKRDRQFEIKDFWTTANRCSYCGSISPDLFIKLALSGKFVTMVKINKTFVIGDMVMRYDHCTSEQKVEIKKMYDNNLINLEKI